MKKKSFLERIVDFIMAILTGGKKDKGTISHIPRYGQQNGAVRQIQNALVAKGYKIDADGEFGPKTQRAIASYQKGIGLNGSGRLGPKTIKALGFVIADEPDGFKPKAPWFWKLKKYSGKSEHNKEFNKEISGYWGKVGLPGFKSIVGSKRAWCGVFIVAGLVQVGMVYQKDGAGAKNWDKYGSAVNWKLNGFWQGSIIRINTKGDCSSAKNNHVTMANGDCTGKDLMKPAAVFSGYGGNQGDKAKVSTYAVNKICSVKWPSKTFVPSRVTLSFNCSNGKTADNESTR